MMMMSHVSVALSHNLWNTYWDILYWSMNRELSTLQNTMNVEGTVFSFGWNIVYSVCMDMIGRRKLKTEILQVIKHIYEVRH